jgi:hypothetical protein
MVAGGSGSACELADASFMTLLLDVASQRLCDLQPISSSHTTAGTVGEAVTEIDGLLSNLTRTDAECDTARAIADDISSGHAIPDILGEELELAVSAKGSGASLSWIASDASDAGCPTAYRVYRSRGLPLSWELLGESACEHWFPDPESPEVGLGDFYRVVPAPAFQRD